VNIKDTIIFSLAIATLIIGLHQSVTVGLEYSYRIFMFSIALLLWLKLRINKKVPGTNDSVGAKKTDTNK